MASTKLPSKKLQFLGAILLLTHVASTVRSQGYRPLPPSDTSDMQLILEDNFDTLDLSLWHHQLTLSGGGNFEFEYYTNNRSNSFVRNGILHIQPTLLADDIGEQNVQDGFVLNIWGNTPAGLCTGPFFFGCERTSEAARGGNILNPIKSANLRTSESFYFKYGKVEVRAKLPRGDWLWPAIWMLPRWNNFGNWPASGEIDIMESRGNAPGYPGGGRNTFGSTLHWGPSAADNAYFRTHQDYTSEVDLSDDFHTYGLIWNETYIGTYIDREDQVVFSLPIETSFWGFGEWESTNYVNPWEGRGNNAPFDSEFYLILNLAVGGVSGFFPDGIGGKPWNNSSPHSMNEFYSDRENWYPTWTQPMMVDYVRVWSFPSGTHTRLNVRGQQQSNSSPCREGGSALVSLLLLLCLLGVLLL